jgi:hypothetical protein
VYAKKRRCDPEQVDYMRYHNSIRRARKRSAVPSWFGEFDKFVIAEAAKLASYRSKMTGIEWHVDHMIPLAASSASGLHVAGNIQVIPAEVNVRKRNSMILTEPLQWLGAL